MDATVKIKINFQQIVEAVKQLTPKEKLKLNDIIFEDSMLISKEHEALVLSRLKKGIKNPERLLDWDEISKTF